MATFVDLEERHYNDLRKSRFPDLGYHIVIFPGRDVQQAILFERELWIQSNVESEWYTFRYNNQPNGGRTYVFKFQVDAIAFKLVWME